MYKRLASLLYLRSRRSPFAGGEHKSSRFRSSSFEDKHQAFADGVRWSMPGYVWRWAFEKVTLREVQPTVEVNLGSVSAERLEIIYCI